GRAADPELRLDPLAQDAAEQVRPRIVGRNPDARRRGLPGEKGRVGLAADGQAVEKVDSRVTQEGVADGQPFRRLERARLAAAEGEGRGPRDVARERG